MPVLPAFLRQTSLAAIALVVGLSLTIVGFGAYFSGNATLNLAGFFYGIPVLLIGLALKSAELKPAPFTQPTSPEVLALREAQATDTQNQVRIDVNRYRYAERAHLLEVLKLSPNDKARPILEGIREEAVEGAYALILEFDSPLLPLERWQEKRGEMETFFGPGVQVQVQEPEEGFIDVAIIAQPKG